MRPLEALFQIYRVAKHTDIGVAELLMELTPVLGIVSFNVTTADLVFLQMMTMFKTLWLPVSLFLRL